LKAQLATDLPPILSEKVLLAPVLYRQMQVLSWTWEYAGQFVFSTHACQLASLFVPGTVYAVCILLNNVGVETSNSTLWLSAMCIFVDPCISKKQNGPLPRS
jgi:hypothetical protein